MKIKVLLPLLLPLASWQTACLAQHHASPSQKSTAVAGTFTAGSVKSQALGDPALKGYRLDALILEVKPGSVDTVSHRHDADVFVFVLEGTVETQLEHGGMVKYTKGQMFYETPNILHTMLKNLSTTESAKLLVNFIIKEGRVAYKPEYPQKTAK